jgi:tetratricopeptide (TPR) repeat protein
MAKLKKFTEFSDGLFPSEVAYVKANNDYRDSELLKILDRVEKRVLEENTDKEFDGSIDPRKYSKLQKSFKNKLSKIDVDRYYEWISKANYLINIDAIPPEEQTRILREIEIFEPGWYHMGSFYRLVERFDEYLVRRYREKDLKSVRAFLSSNRKNYLRNLETSEKINSITDRVVFGRGNGELNKDLSWLLKVFYDEELSKKNRYGALVSFMMYHINLKNIDQVIEPMRILEKAIFDGDFYSRRILANFYANKLLLLNYRGKFEEAAFCGRQSIKHYTEDFLYYLNNYSSVLMHLNRCEIALSNMDRSMKVFKSTRDKGRKVIFISNYCRCLNRLGQYKKSVRIARRFLDEMGTQIMQYRWHYFFRIFFFALLQANESEQMMKIERKFKLVDRERKSGLLPYLAILKLGASYREVRLSQKEFDSQLSSLKTEFKAYVKPELQELLSEIERMG